MKNHKNKKHSGFTKVEAIVVIAIVFILIGLIVLVAWYLNKKNEDVAVLSDISRIQSTLTVVAATNTFYPMKDDLTPLGSRAYQTERLCLRGFREFTQPCEKVLLSPLPNSTGMQEYLYRSPSGNDYQIQFFLQTNFNSLGLQAGQQCASLGGIVSQPCLEEAVTQ